MAGPGRPGRPRRSSNSTAETVDHERIRYTKASSILKAVPPTVPSDNWPCFVLTDAIVYKKDGKTLANVTNVGLEGPFILRGRLEVEEKEHKRYLRNSSIRFANIEIPASYSYSIGIGPYPVVWASGEAGWFEINPAPQYQTMYDKVCEGITLYYTVMDVYENPAPVKKGKGKKAAQPLTLDQVFLKYAVAVGDGSVRDEVEARCHEHAQFLLSHFPKESTFNWKKTYFYKWLNDTHSDVAERLRKAASGEVVVQQPPDYAVDADSDSSDKKDRQGSAKRRARSSRSKSALSNFKTDEDEEMAEAPVFIETPTTSTRGSFHGKAKSSTPLSIRSRTSPAQTATQDYALVTHGSSQAPSRPSAADVEPAAAFLMDLLGEIEGEIGDISKIKASTVQSRLFYKCTLKGYKAAPDVINFYADVLLARLNPRWHPSPFYNHLKTVSAQPLVPEFLSIDEIPGQLVRRRKSGKTATTELSREIHQGRPGYDDAMDEDPPTRSGKHPQPPSSGRQSGKSAGLRLASMSRKRFGSEIEDEDPRGKKSARTAHLSSEEDDNVDDDGDDDSASSSHDSDAPDASSGTEPVRVVVRAENIPSMSPSGPNGTWTCEEEGCGYVVRAANDRIGKELIAAHFKEHEAQAEKISLAVNEGTRGHPVDHLLEKIRKMGKQVKEEEQVLLNGSVLPDPIKRRLLV